MKKSIWLGLLLLVLLPINPAFAAKETFDEAIKKHQFKVPVDKKEIAMMKDTSTLLISCVDFRLRHETEKLMRNELHLLNDYDEVAMPGASLAVVATQYPEWQKTLNDIIGLVEKLHNIERIILLDHRDCGAYKLIKGEDYVKNREMETKVHEENLLEAKKVLEKKFPNLKVYTLLLGLDGVVDNFHD